MGSEETVKNCNMYPRFAAKGKEMKNINQLSQQEMPNRVAKNVRKKCQGRCCKLLV